jgi:RNA polymerase sigma-70 factor (ECF subfamily)
MRTTYADSALIRLALAGDPECFNILMDRHIGGVRRRLSSLVRNAADADDVLQEVRLKVWRRLSTYRSESSFRTWMTRVAINEAMQLYRSERRRPLSILPADFDAVSSADDSPYHALARSETTRAVRNAVAELPPAYSQVVILRDFNELSTRETAQRLRSSISAVKSRHFRARAMLVAALQRLRARDDQRAVGTSM